MMAMILGKKIGMTQVYDEEGRMTPVTVIQAGPCKVLQVKTEETDGYNALQLGYEDVKKSRVKKPAAGHSAKASTAPKRFVREWRLGCEPEKAAGDDISVTIFAEEETKMVDVSGVSKGKGFAGGMKRHGFGGFPGSHGTKRKHRAPGSLASHAAEAGRGAKPKKGKRMAGHMGHVRVTSKNHMVVSVDAENNILVVKGSVPGPSGAYVEVCSSKRQPK